MTNTDDGIDEGGVEAATEALDYEILANEGLITKEDVRTAARNAIAAYLSHVQQGAGVPFTTHGMSTAEVERRVRSAEAKRLPTEPAALQPGAGDGWNSDMGAAPKDGTRIIIAWGGASVVGYYLDNSGSGRPWHGWRVPSMEPTPRGLPTHWRPLPPPPEPQREGE